jgi:hypothetical protein
MATAVYVVVGVVLLALYALWRYKKSITAEDRFANLMPSRNRLGWTTESTRTLKNRTGQLRASADCDGRLAADAQISAQVRPTTEIRSASGDLLESALIGTAVADTVAAAWSIADSAANIDPQVLQALEFSTAEHLHGLGDINSYVHAHFFDAPTSSADGWFERLTGYVGEQKAAVALEQAGGHVEFAPVANQPVWDLLVDGHPVQIKEGLVGTKDFIAHHPGIPVFTGPDVAVAIKDPSVHALDVLDKDSIHAATEQSLDGVDAVIDPGFHVPVVTMAFSSWREAKLLWKEKTTFGRALKNVGMDVAGVGVGWLAGAKAGGLLGSVFGVLGAAVGVIAGGITGAIGGKLTSTAMRHAPFKEAREAYNQVVTEAQQAVESKISDSKQRVTELQLEYQQRFIEDRTRVADSVRQRVGDIRSKFENNLVDFCERFPTFLRDLKTQLDGEERDVLSRLPSTSIFDWIFASENALYRGVVKAWFKRARKSVDSELDVFGEIAPRTAQTLHAEIQRFLNKYEFELESLAGALRRVRHECLLAEEQVKESQMGAVAEITSIRNTLIQSFGQKVIDLHERIVEEIRAWNGKIEARKSVLKREAASIGIDL